MSVRAAGLLALLAGPAFADGLTAVAGIQVGHHTLAERPTGCTVVLVPAGAAAGVDVRGGAPGTIGTDLLAPTASDTRLHAVVLSGGSAFGLDTAAGVMRFLEERGVGYETRAGRVPIVAGAILFDLGVGSGSAKPAADCGYRAASAAAAGPVAEGSVGAGAGATVGKLGPIDRAMKAGIGSASITVPGGVTVAALVAVNALGDVVDPDTGRIVAGTRNPDGTFADARRLLRAGRLPWAPPSAENTTLVVVATDAALSKAEASKVAQMAHDGLARSIVPVHTMRDGDTVFALATGARKERADVTLVGSLAADAVAQAVVRAVRQATGVPGFPAVRDLAGDGAALTLQVLVVDTLRLPTPGMPVRFTPVASCTGARRPLGATVRSIARADGTAAFAVERKSSYLVSVGGEMNFAKNEECVETFDPPPGWSTLFVQLSARVARFEGQ